MSALKELLPIVTNRISDEEVNTVDAKNLHQALGVGKLFRAWIQERIEKYDLKDGMDYIVVESLSSPKTDSPKARPQVVKTYYLTVDCAKELAMVQNNEQGKEVRQYFIRCEKELRNLITPKQHYLLNILSADDELSRAIAINEYEVGYVKPLEAQVTVLKPKGAYFDALVDRNLLTNLRDTAKEFHLGQKAFITMLIEKGFLYRDKKGKLKPYQEYVTEGVFELKEFQTESYTDVQTLVTPKGRETFRLLLSL